VWYAPVGKVVHRSGHSWHQLDDEGKAHFRLSRRRELMADAGRMSAFIYLFFERLSRYIAQRRKYGD
jgi:hypothetical protein